MHWYEKESNRNRLQKIEQAIMARKFPQFSLFLGGGKYRFAGPGILFWGGRLRTNFGNAYMVAVTYPENFPYGQIKSYVPSLIGGRAPLPLFQRPRRKGRRNRQGNHRCRHSGLDRSVAERLGGI